MAMFPPLPDTKQEPTAARGCGLGCLGVIALVFILWLIGSANRPNTGPSNSMTRTYDAPASPRGAAAIQVTNMRWKSGEYANYIEADAVNNGAQTLTSVMIEFDVYDKRDRKLGTAVAIFRNVAPGERMAIHEYCFYDTAHTFRLSNISAY